MAQAAGEEKIKVYVHGGKDGMGIRIVSKDADDPMFRCGRLSVFFYSQKDGGHWIGITTKEIFTKGWNGMNGANPSEDVRGKVARTFEWKDGKPPQDICPTDSDMIIDPNPIGEVLREAGPFQVVVRIYPAWVAANRDLFKQGQWMNLAGKDEIKPGTKVQYGLPKDKKDGTH